MESENVSQGHSKPKEERAEYLLLAMRDPAKPGVVKKLLEDVGITAATVTYWKKNIPGFRRKYAAAFKTMQRKHLTKVELGLVKTGWEDTFLEVYPQTGRFNYSCQLAGVDPQTVKKRLDKDNSCYDPVFSEAFGLCDPYINQSLEDLAHKKAIEDESEGMIKFLLTTKMPEKYGKTVTHSVMNAQVNFLLVEERAEKFLQEVFGPVIEAELVSATQEQKRIPESV